MPKISVIIPVYNAEEYLEKCLNSVCNQTLQDIEIICIDDASNDGSNLILQKYCKQDCRIKLITLTENQGAAKARNIGIASAIAEYLGFVDADDFIDKNFYEKLYNKALETKADAVKGNIRIYSLQNKKITNEAWIDLNEEVKKHHANFCFSFTSAIYKRLFILENSVQFLEGLIHFEDPFFTIKAALFYKKLVVIDDVFYYYVNNPNSVTRKKFTKKHMDSLIIGAGKVLDLLDDSCQDKIHYIIVFNFLLEQIFHCGGRIGVDFDVKKQANEATILLYQRCKYQAECRAYRSLKNQQRYNQEIVTQLRSKIKYGLK